MLTCHLSHRSSTTALCRLSVKRYACCSEWVIVCLPRHKWPIGPCVATPVSHKARWLCPNPLLQGVLLKVFKTLHSNQHALGISIKDVKSHVLLTGISEAELKQASMSAIEATLQESGWWRLRSGHMLSSNLLNGGDGAVHTCSSLQFDVEVQPPGRIIMLMQPSIMQFRHPATSPVPQTGDANLMSTKPQQPLHQVLPGSICSVLPDFR